MPTSPLPTTVCHLLLPPLRCCGLSCSLPVQKPQPKVLIMSCLNMPKGREEELWHPHFKRVPVYDVKGRQNSSPSVNTACFHYCSHQVMSLAEDIPSKLFQVGFVALEIQHPKRKAKRFIVSQFVPTFHQATSLFEIFYNKEREKFILLVSPYQW